MTTVIIIAAVLLVVLNILDAITTKKALSIGLRESNKIMRYLQNKFGVNTSMVIKGILTLVVAVFFIYYRDSNALIIPLLILNIGYGYIVNNNYKFLKKYDS